MRTLLFCASLFVGLFGRTQMPAVAWQKCLGGSDEEGRGRVVPTSDGGYFLTTNTLSNNGDVSGHHGTGDAWVAKLDALGDVLWQRALGGTMPDYGEDGIQTADGGYIVAATTMSDDGDVTGHHGLHDAWIVKLDASGTITWNTAIGGAGSDAAYSVQQTGDGGYFIVGTTDSNDGDVAGNHGNEDVWAVRLDPAGTLLWQRCLGGSGNDRGRSGQQTSDGGYIVCGQSTSNDGDVSGAHGSNDMWVVKLDPVGNVQWQRALGGTLQDRAYCVRQASDGGYVVCGSTGSIDGDVSSSNGGGDLWLVKLDPAGALEWENTLGGSLADSGAGLALSPSGYVFMGTSDSQDGDLTTNQGGSDYWVGEVDLTGTLLWQLSLGGSDSDFGATVHALGNGDLILGGETFSPDGDVTNFLGTTDAWVVKLTAGLSGIGEEDPLRFSVCPVPAATAVQVTTRSAGSLVLRDALGREVLTTSTYGTTHTLDVAALPRGLYTITLRTIDGSWSQRLVLE